MFLTQYYRLFHTLKVITCNVEWEITALKEKSLDSNDTKYTAKTHFQIIINKIINGNTTYNPEKLRHKILSKGKSF